MLIIVDKGLPLTFNSQTIEMLGTPCKLFRDAIYGCYLRYTVVIPLSLGINKALGARNTLSELLNSNSWGAQVASKKADLLMGCSANVVHKRIDK